MDDLVQQTVQKFHISSDDTQGNRNDDDASSSTTIPILKRSLAAKAQSKKLRELSPVCVIVVGMAGSGKTTLMSALQRSLTAAVYHDDDKDADRSDNENKDEKSVNQEGKSRGYCVNLDPATKLVPFGASIDIRDTVNYKEVMKQHNLGPNGSIMLALNFFSTKFDQVISILEKRSFSSSSPVDDNTSAKDDKENSTSSSTTIETQTKKMDYILVDTPGQIEAFTWSASGSIFTSALSSAFPTVLAFVVDTPRCINSLNTFMSNMLYACSMFYRTRLPLVVVFNKCDVTSCEVCMEWMEDYEKFQEALDEFMSSDQSGYYATLTRSLSLVLDEFYNTLQKVGVSAATGDGVDEFWTVVGKAADDFDVDYVGDLGCRVKEQEAKKRAIAKDSLKRLEKDVESTENTKRS